MTESSDRAVETRLRAAVESAPSGLLMTDAEGRIVLVNREVERLFGYAREELLGQPIEVLIPMRFRDRHPGFRHGFRGDPRVRAMGAGRDLNGRRKDGTEVPVEVGLTPVATPEGMFVIGSVVDISARKLAEHEQRRFAEQLRQSQKLEAVGTLAGGIAHDFNNVLSAIMGYAELLDLSLHDRPDAREDVRQILVATQRGRELAQQILAFSRQQEVTREPIALLSIVHEVQQLLRATLPLSVRLTINSEHVVDPVLADVTSLHQVVMNLATNAVQAMPAGGTVYLDVRRYRVMLPQVRANPELREGWYTLLTVRDTGTGMDAQTLARAREPFFTTKLAGAGTGLGLSVVHGVMQTLGGSMEIESAIGEGTEVRCYFPALASMPADVAPPPSVAPAPRGCGEHILYVDDEPSLRRIGERVLAQIGYRVTSAGSPAEAIALVEETTDGFALLVTDFSMPEMNGVELAHTLTAHHPLPVILLTGYVEVLDPAVLHAAGIRRVLSKPSTQDELAHAVHEVLTERAASA